MHPSFFCFCVFFFRDFVFCVWVFCFVLFCFVLFFPSWHLDWFFQLGEGVLVLWEPKKRFSEASLCIKNAALPNDKPTSHSPYTLPGPERGLWVRSEILNIKREHFGDKILKRIVFFISQIWREFNENFFLFKQFCHFWYQKKKNGVFGWHICNLKLKKISGL